MCANSKWHQLKGDHSVSKEFKLEVTNWYFENRKNNQTANNFQIDRKQVRNWLKHEEKICSLKRSKKACRYGKTKFPVMEKEVYTKFLDMRKEAKRVKCWWFNTKARELVEEKYPDEASSFKLSYRWCEGFCRRHSIIFLLRKTHAVQKSSAALRTAIEKFHAMSLRERKRRIFPLMDLVTWTKHRFFLSWMAIEPIKRLVLKNFG